LKAKKDQTIHYYPNGFEGDSIEMKVIKRRGNSIVAVLTPNGMKDAEYFGWLYELMGEVEIEARLTR
jgi:hypothetical protein